MTRSKQLDLELKEPKDPPEVRCCRYNCALIDAENVCTRRTNLHNDPNFDCWECPFFKRYEGAV